MASSKRSPESPKAPSLTSIPFELKILAVEKADYHDLRSLRATCKDFYSIITPEELRKRRELKMQELNDGEISLEEVLYGENDLRPTKKDIFAGPLFNSSKKYVYIMDTLQLACHTCLKEKPIFHFMWPSPVGFSILSNKMVKPLKTGSCPSRQCDDCKPCASRFEPRNCLRCGCIATLFVPYGCHELVTFVTLVAEDTTFPRCLFISRVKRWSRTDGTQHDNYLCDSCHFFHRP